MSDITGGFQYLLQDDHQYVLWQDAWDDLRVPFSTLNTAGVKAPDYVKYADDGAGSTGVYGYAFSPTAEEEVFFEVQLPHDWHEGTEIEPHLHISTPPSTGSDGDVVFGLEYILSDVNEAWDATTTTTYVTRTIDGSADDGKQLIAGFEPDIDMTGKSASAMLICRVFRDATAVEDTYPGDVFVWECDFHYRKDGLGSRYTFQKVV